MFVYELVTQQREVAYGGRCYVSHLSSTSGEREESSHIAIIIPSDDYTRNHGCTNYPGHDGSFPYGRHIPEQYLVISIKGLMQRS